MNIRLFLDSKLKLQATFRQIAYPDGTTMQQYGILDDGQSQTCASHLAAAPLINPIKSFEESSQMLRRYTLPIIPEDKMPLVPLLLCLQSYRTSLTGIGYGIISKIAEHALEQTAVSLHHDAFRQLIIKGHLVLLSSQCRLLRDVSHHLRNIHRFKINHIRSIVQAVER